MINQIRKNSKITFRYCILDVGNTKKTEDELLRAFEDIHFDLPVCNFTRGYSRNEDEHYK